MNKFIKAINSLDLELISVLIREEPQWLAWAEENGKNALHYLCSINAYGNSQKAAAILQVLQLLLQNGMDMNAVDNIGPQGHPPLPATPLYYACEYGKNEMLYTWLLKNGATAPNCLPSLIANDDISGAELFQQYGHTVEHAEKTRWNALLIWAYMWPRYKMAKWLLVNGADVNAVDQNGETVLFHAVKNSTGWNI